MLKKMLYKSIYFLFLQKNKTKQYVLDTRISIMVRRRPWPATKDELIDFAIRSGSPMEVIENLQEMEDEGEAYETIEEIWPDYPTKDDFFFNEDEY